MLLFIAVLLIFQLPYVHFNTSHVTVYLGGNGMITKMMRFQYISCYCLSQVPCQETARSCISIHLMLLFIKSQKIFFFNHFPFQYISCYCLSGHRHHKAVPVWISIHLMLLFIFMSLLSSDRLCHFNTSHVTVYQNQQK